MARTTFTDFENGDPTDASQVEQFVAPIHALEDFRDDAGPRVPTSDEKAALQGSAGSPDGWFNRYVTQQDRLVSRYAVRFRDDFLGARAPNWTLTGGTCAQQSGAGGVGQMATGASANDQVTLDFGGATCTATFATPRMLVMARLGQTADCKVQIGLYKDADNLIEWIYDSAAGSNWKVRCRAGGVETVTDTGWAADTDGHEFNFEVGEGTASFWSDILFEPIVVDANIPADLMEPRIRLETLTAASATMKLDLVDLLAGR